MEWLCVKNASLYTLYTLMNGRNGKCTFQIRVWNYIIFGLFLFEFTEVDKIKMANTINTSEEKKNEPDEQEKK